MHPLDSAPDLDLDDPWGIYYTGGTTGLPKGAVLTHGNVTWNSVNTITSWGITGQHKAALQLPFFHIGGPNIFMVPLVHAGGATILCAGFDPDETFDLVERSGITHYVAVPTMFQMLQEHPRWDEADFSKLELVISGGAPCPLPIMEKFWERGVDFKMGYGLTEASGNNFWLPPERVREKIGSVGYPIFHIDMKIIREDGTKCADGEAGRIADPRPARRRRLLAEPGGHGGNDPRRLAAHRRHRGARRRRLFLDPRPLQGNVHQRRRERLPRRDRVRAAGASAGAARRPWSACRTRPGARSAGPSWWSADGYDEEALRAFLGERLARYKLPRSMVVLDALPLTAIGKIDKKLLDSREAPE